MQEADPNRDMTFVASPTMKRDLNDPEIWRRLHEEKIGLTMLWKDRSHGRWYAYATYPWLPDDNLPYWCSDYDDRTTLMFQGETPKDAVLGLFDHPNRLKRMDSFRAKITALTIEVASLVEVLQNGS